MCSKSFNECKFCPRWCAVCCDVISCSALMFLCIHEAILVGRCICSLPVVHMFICLAVRSPACYETFEHEIVV